MVLKFKKQKCVDVSFDTVNENSDKKRIARNKPSRSLSDIEDVIFDLAIKENIYLDNTRLVRMSKHVKDSGYDWDNISQLREIVKDYFTFRKYFPRTPYRKDWLDKTKYFLENIELNEDGEIDAKQIYFLAANNIGEFSDPIFYAWFQKVGSKFKTSGLYSLEVVTLVIYSAIAWKNKRDAR
jgi:hypothetical protein